MTTQKTIITITTGILIALLLTGCGPVGQEQDASADDTNPGQGAESITVPTTAAFVPDAVVESSALNVRTGPSPDFPIAEIVQASAELLVEGQAFDCDWLQVTTAAGTSGWVNRPYIALNRSCAQIAEVTNIPLILNEGLDDSVAVHSSALVRLLQPRLDVLGGRQHFIWEPSQPLAEGQVYELLFWRPGQEPLLTGVSPVAHTSLNQVAFNLEDAVDTLPQLSFGKDYFWSVALVDKTNNTKQLLHPGHRFHLDSFARSQRENSPSPSLPTETPVPTPLSHVDPPTPSNEVIGTSTEEPP